MAKVLIIDAAPMLRDFVKEKLSSERVEVETATNRDAYTKMINTLPDLIILNIDKHSSGNPINENIVDFFQKKSRDPNSKTTPIIITGPNLSTEAVAKLVQFGVIKYFKKPIKFDVFFDAIGKQLNGIFSIDTTPCVLDLHLNDNNNVIFIEVAMGLNREKISLLKYKISELINANDLSYPKVILMMTSLSLSFVDGMNLELLFNNILADNRISRKNVKVLSLDSIVSELIEGHPEYEGIEVTKDLSTILNSIVTPKNSSSGANVADVISDNILTATAETQDSESMGMRFATDTETAEELKSEGTTLRVAAVDDDQIVRALIHKAFLSIGAETDLFASGREFVEKVVEKKEKHYDIIILDIFMNDMNGFEVLIKLKENTIATPVIVYSQAIKRDMIVKSLSLGARSYVLKPQKPENIVKKAMEVLNAGKTE
ncbi:response regulator [Treponema saccharophilum]|uniref:Response regulator receiver protein n=1 Tax=Treponema saccharophilum DSM 2985 TaxID=907348 RepID=H7EN33_9SPIR|nr:response regulator [Treponema saccharophilum]EIC01097.1 response regulator receiver protein [Treponema saccharophilum DSM 2985]EIC03188.1 response regulator receiver protein [Treponema saccharophilum DSM 2985]BDC95409.1 hypothetical protein TRSA_05080 [Treponema saccharophilum]